MTAMLVRQVRHELVGLWRTPVVVFFALVFPLAFFVIMSALLGNETIDARSGVRFAQFLAPAFASFGVAMATYSFLAIGFSEIRFNGVLKRLTGGPLPRWVLIGGRVGAGTLVSLASVLLLIVVGIAFYDVVVVWERAPAILVTCLVAALSFSALGIAVASLASSMQAATAWANGTVIPLAFISDLFLVGELPSWLATIGWVFPLKHLVNALGDGFNPFVDGNGLYLDHLAVIAAWGVAGALLAAWGIRRQADRAERGQHPSPESERAAPRGPAEDRVPRRDGRPSAVALVRDQTRHANALQWRDRSSPLFGIGMPVFLIVLFPVVFSGGDAAAREEVAQLIAATMTVYGAAVIAYVNLPQGLAEAAEAGVLKRWAGTPLPTWAVLVGRVVSAVLLALILVGLAYAVAVPLYSVVVPPSWPSALLILVLSTASFCALGMGVVSVVRGAQAALGVCLGSLIMLSFVSDIFIVGADFPDWLDAISWFFPLRHAVNAFADAMAADASGLMLPADHLAVVVAWGALGVLVVLTRFNTEPRARRSAPTTQSVAAA